MSDSEHRTNANEQSDETELQPRLTNSMSDAQDGTSPTNPQEDATRWVGQTLGRYEIRRLLGQGGMGAVYLAWDTQLERNVALKIPNFQPGDKGDVIDRFYREAKAAATLRHAHICPTHDVGQIDGVHFISMAYIPGKTLSELLRHGRPVKARQVATLVADIAGALHEAHQHGIVHRDLKPSNIMITRDREPIVMDFGLARRLSLADGIESRLTHSGMILGTPAYMPPEQICGDVNAMGPHSDVYSLGVVMYELLTGQLPFQGPVGAVLSQVMSIEPKKPAEIYAKVDRQLEAICLKALAKATEDRYGSMAEIRDALRKYLKATSSSSEASPSTEPSVVDDSINTSSQALLRPVVGLTLDARAAHALTKVVSPITAVAARRLKIRTGLWVATGFVALFVLFGIVIKVFDKAGNQIAEIRGDRVVVESDNEDSPDNTPPSERGAVVPGQNDGTTQDSDPLEVAPTIDQSSPFTPFTDNWLLVPRQPLADGRTWTVATRGHSGSVYDISFRPDGSQFASVGADRVLRLWSTKSRELIRALPLNDEARSLAWSPDGAVLAIGEGNDIRLIDSNTCQTVLHWVEHVRPISGLEWSPSGKRLASCDGESLVIWDRDAKFPTVFRRPAGQSKWVSEQEIVYYNATEGAFYDFDIDHDAVTQVARDEFGFDQLWDMLASSRQLVMVSTSRNVAGVFGLDGSQRATFKLNPEGRPCAVAWLGQETIAIAMESGPASRVEYWEIGSTPMLDAKSEPVSIMPSADGGHLHAGSGLFAISHLDGSISLAMRGRNKNFILGSSAVAGNPYSRPFWSPSTICIPNVLPTPGATASLVAINLNDGSMHTSRRFAYSSGNGQNGYSVARMDNGFAIWDLGRGGIVRDVPSSVVPDMFSMSPNQRYVAAFVNEVPPLGFSLIDTTTTEQSPRIEWRALGIDEDTIREITGVNGFHFAWSQDSSRLAVDLADGATSILTCTVAEGGRIEANGLATFRTQQRGVIALRWLDDFQALEFITPHLDVIQWDMGKRQVVSSQRLPFQVADDLEACFSQDGRQIAVFDGALSRVYVYDRPSSRRISTVQLLRGLESAAFVDGLYCLSRNAKRDLVYLVEGEDGSDAFAFDEFHRKYDVKSERDRLTLAKNSDVD